MDPKKTTTNDECERNLREAQELVRRYGSPDSSPVEQLLEERKRQFEREETLAAHYRRQI
jgi:hypothetical protein